jgi:hypothetical protein
MRMYRIELAPGEETVFRTIDELAVAVRNGLVTSRARIYHNASQKWLPIEFHPHYKNALKLPPTRPDARMPERTGPLNFAVVRADEPETPTATSAEAAPVLEAPAAVEAEAVVVEEPSAPPVAVPPVAVPPLAVTEEPRVEAARAEALRAEAARAEAARAVPPTAVTPMAARPMPVPPMQAAPMPVRPMPVPPAVPSPTLKLPTIWTPEMESADITSPGISSREITDPVLTDPELTDPEITDPDITYPEFARAVATAPGRATSRRRSRRPLHLAGAAALVALGVYALMSAFSPSRGEAASARKIADRPAMPRADSVDSDAQQPDAPRMDATRLSSEAATPPAAALAKAAGPAPRARPPAPIAMTEPASSGFAPALESRAIVSTAPATVRVDTPGDSTIAPAPAAVDLAVPALPGVESLVATPHPQGDSALKRILRAVNGGKDAPPHP